MINTYCTGCHSSQARAGGLALDAMDLDAVAADAQVWEKAVRKLRGRLMPPPGARQPDQQEVDSLVGWLETHLDEAPEGIRAGYVPIQRLNRTEYAAAVKMLVGVEVNPEEILPQDVAIEGFDNIAAALSVSPAFVDQYLSAARTIARKAVGGEFLENVKYTLSENRGGEMMPLGLRDGLMFQHNFPADGEYRVNVLFPDQTVGLYTGSLENENTLVIMVDGRILFREPIGGLKDLMLNNLEAGDGRAKIMERFTKVPIRVQAGVHQVVIGFIERSQFESTANTGGGRFGGNQPGLGDIEIVGPYDSTGVTSPSRALIYVCDPETEGEAACARKIAENLATRAFRRPATEDDLARLLPFFEAGREEGGDFDRGVERLVTAVLVSPDFLYRSVHTAEGQETQLDDLELASRLSFFIWSTPPDQELFDLAVANRLSEPAMLDAQVRRMLDDPKASSLVSSFAMKWLRLNDVDALTPDSEVFPGFDRQLPGDFLREVQLFIGSVLLEDRSIIDLLTSDETFLNDRLARHYGIEGITGSQFRRVRVTDETRFGLLGKAAVLMATSYANRTSPVLRGAWVLDKLLGTPPTPPPPNVEAFPETQAGERPRTVRARLEQHRASPVCGQCHGVIDPIGLALENFDGIGRWRTTDAAADAAIDASTELPTGVAIDGPVELRDQLVARPDMFAQVVTEKLMMYALGRELEYFDMPQVRAIVRNAANEDYRWSSIVLGIVRSDAFRMQGPEPSSAPEAIASN
jgi:Protein of unknown function (DUF1592)/Protein of unknown function (DUF1588)/Protein of unknown function (DUF1585)/Protein of unknown function (DUF1595)/Protein of unknown function (DUF1587)/Planctomycete cytochrome C